MMRQLIGLSSLLIAGTLLISSPSLAVTIDGVINGESIQWNSATYSGNRLTPAYWDVALSLPTAEAVHLGAPMKMDRTVIFQKGSERVSTDTLRTIGVEYRLSFPVPPPQGHGRSQEGSNMLPTGVDTIAVFGTDVDPFKMEMNNTQSPFTHYRPLIDMNNDIRTLVEDFKQAKVSAGEYISSFFLTVPYDYYRNGIRIRNTLTIPVNIKLTYNPASLTEVVVDGTGIISPIYNPDNTVDGSTIYNVTARGVLPNGVKVGLLDTLNGQPHYTLKDSASDIQGPGIKYSVTCSSCLGGTDIIQDGVAKIDSVRKTLSIPSNDNKTATTQIEVSFKGQNLDDLNNATYTGQFTLIFSAMM